MSVSEPLLPAAVEALASVRGVQEAAILCTCNRFEVYAVVDEHDRDSAAERIAEAVGAISSVPLDECAPYLYRYTEAEAATHAMRVAAGLDSQIRGEAQIIGQMRTALRIAQAAGTIGPTLTALLQRAIATGKRVQTETNLGRGAFSIGRAAVDLAGTIFSELAHATVLVLGAGKMSELTARHLVAAGVRFVVVANRTYDRAVAMADRLGGSAICYDAFPEALMRADIVIASTAAPHPILTRDAVQAAMRKRRGRPLFLIDIAVPRDIEPAAGDLDNVFLYNIDDLQACVSDSVVHREAGVEQAEAIAAEGAAEFLTLYRMRGAAPIITELRERIDQIRRDDMALLRARLRHLSDHDWQAIEKATRAMMNRVAREPILRLKQESGAAHSSTGIEHERYDLFTAVREIFGLGETTAARERTDNTVESVVDEGEAIVADDTLQRSAAE